MNNNITTESLRSGMTSFHRNTFENRSHSLNMPARNLEDQRVLRENYKLMMRICNAQPQKDLQRRKLSQEFQNAVKMKKLIATKYLRRDEMQVYKALIKNAEVRSNLPQLSPISDPHTTINLQFGEDSLHLNKLAAIGSDQSI